MTLHFLTKLCLSITNIFLSECKLLFQVILVLHVLTFSEKSARLKALVFRRHSIQAMLKEILRHQLLSNDLFRRNILYYRFLLLFHLDLCFFHLKFQFKYFLDVISILRLLFLYLFLHLVVRREWNGLHLLLPVSCALQQILCLHKNALAPDFGTDWVWRFFNECSRTPSWPDCFLGRRIGCRLVVKLRRTHTANLSI